MSARLPFFEAIQAGCLYRIYVTSSDLICVRLGRDFVVERPSAGEESTKIYWWILGGVVVVVIAAFAVLIALSFTLNWERRTKAILIITPTSLFAIAVRIAIRITLILFSPSGSPGICGVDGPAPGNVIDEAGRFEAGVKDDLKLLERFSAVEMRDYVKEKKRGFVLAANKLDDARIGYVGKWRRLYLGRPSLALVLDHSSKGRLKFAFRKRSDVVIGLFEMDRLLGDALEVDVDADSYKKALKKYEKMRSS